MAESIVLERNEKSYKIVNCREFGDYLIAEQTFEEGETVFKEETLLSSPLEDQLVIRDPEVCCVGCYKVITSISNSCCECRFPVCNAVCSQNEFHKNLECGILAENSIEPNESTFGFLKYLRVLLSRNVYPTRYEEFQLLTTEFNSEFVEFSLVTEGSQAVWDFLTEECHLEVTLLEVRNIWIALKINSFVLYEEDNSGTRYRGNGVFTLGCKLSHSCSPSLEWLFSKTEVEDGTFKWYMQVHAKRKIKKGEVLSIAYSTEGLHYGTGFRREKHQTSLSFRCLCPRCLSPTEEGTHFSSPKCLKCKRGYVLPEEPLSSLTCTWKCSHCTFSKDGVEVKKSVSKCETLVSLFMNQEPSSLDCLDTFIENNSGISLHPNHFIIFQCIYYWLLNSHWTAKLIMQDNDSVVLYDKILTRFNRCLPLVQKFLTTWKIIQLETAVVSAIAAFAFKSDDSVTINCIYVDCRLKFRFCKMIVYHLSRANFWIQSQSSYQGCEGDKESLTALYGTWSRRLEIYKEELLSQETTMQDVALSRMRSIFG